MGYAMSSAERAVNVIVCVKQILDPDIPIGKFRIDSKACRVVPPEGIVPVINPYDAQAVELALRLEAARAGKITVLTVGPSGAEKAVKHALAMGADEGIVLWDPAYEGSDGTSIARILAAAIRKIGAFDLVLTGRQAADWDEGLVGPTIARMLDLPLVTLAASVEASKDRLAVRRVTLDGFETYEVDLPAVVTVSSEVGRPRLAAGWGIVQAARAKVPVWSAADVGIARAEVGAGAARRRLRRLEPAARERRCEILRGTVAEATTAPPSPRTLLR